jgi:carbamoyl-phosphate synthase large subunit
VLIPGIMEHIERAGVHSGDSMAVYPPITLTEEERETIVDYTTRIGLALGVRGLMNIQYVIVNQSRPFNLTVPVDRGLTDVYIIEVNPRSSRTVPFISKVTGIPMVKLATNVMLGKTIREQGHEGGLQPEPPMVSVKAPVFSMSKLTGVDTYLGPEMKSTGEVMGIDATFGGAFAKAQVAAGTVLPLEGTAFLSVPADEFAGLLPVARRLATLGFRLIGTRGTAGLLGDAGLSAEVVKKVQEGSPNVVDVIQSGQVALVVNTPAGADSYHDSFPLRRAALDCRVPYFTSLAAAAAAAGAIELLRTGPLAVVPLQARLPNAAGPP